MTVCFDLVGGDEEGCYDCAVFGCCCISGSCCVLGLAHGLQTCMEEACCRNHPYCSICLDTHCYAKTDSTATGFHSAAPRVADVVPPFVVNRGSK